MEGMMHDMRGGRGMPEMGGMAGMMHEMMGPPTPAMILHHKTDLKLTDAQVSKLEALQKQAEPACRQHLQAGMTAHKAANTMLDAPSPDWNAYTAKMKEATAHMVEGVVPMAKAAVSARDVLTPEQRTTLKNLMEQMHKK
jgi:Spy/CpxP family protein refolding chaperone